MFPLTTPPTSLVVASGTRFFISNNVNADVVMDEVIGDLKMGHVPIQCHRFAFPGPQIIEFVTTDNQVADGSLRRSISEETAGVAVLRSGRNGARAVLMALSIFAFRSRYNACTGRLFRSPASGIFLKVPRVIDMSFISTTVFLSASMQRLPTPLCASANRDG